MPGFAPELLDPSVALFFIGRFACDRGPMVEIISNTLPSGHRDRLECEVKAALQGRPASEDWEVSLLGSPSLARIVVFIRSPARRFRKAWVFDQPESVRDAIETELIAAGL